MSYVTGKKVNRNVAAYPEAQDQREGGREVT